VTPEELERFAAMERRLQDLETRLAHLEASPPARAKAAVPLQPMPPPAPPRPKLETAVGVAWLSRIAVVTVVLALAFFFDYAFENRWIGERGRVLLGLGCGAAALAFAESCWRKGQRTFGQSMAAAAIGFFYLSFWAAFALYHLISQPMAFALMLLATAAAGGLAFRYDGAPVAALGLAGGYATPLLLGGAGEPWFLLGYALLLSAGGAMAARRRGWRWIEALALSGGALLYLHAVGQSVVRGLDTGFVTGTLALFGTAAWLPVCAAEELLAAPALAAIWAPGPGGLVAPLVCAAAGLAVARRRKWSWLPSASFFGFWIAYAIWRASAASEVAPGVPISLASLAFLLFLAWPLAPGRPLRGLDLMLVPLDAAFYFGAGYSLLHPRFPAWEGLFAVAVAAACLFAARLLWRSDGRAAQLAAGAGCALLVLAAPIQFAGYRVTMAWSLEAAAIVWLGTRGGVSRRLALGGGLAVFLLVLGRLALLDSGMYSDAAAYSTLANARFLTFLVAAAALCASARWLPRGGWAAAAWIAGHAVMLWGLGLETAGWAERAAAPENLRSLFSASLSVVAAAYAVTMVAGGALRRHDLTRVLGIGLIALVVLKLYLYDVWFLAPLYRMAAFAILGVLLLAMSYLYSRFRGSIESWWKPNP